MTAVIAVTSGKPEVGKSMLSTNLALYLNQSGYRTGLLAAGAGHPIWGIEPCTCWPDILTGRLSLDKTVHREVFGIDLMVTQGHGHALQGLAAEAVERLDDQLDMLNALAYLIVDIHPGITAPAMACCLAATETIMVLSPDTPTISATYDWLAQLTRHGFSGPANLILNKVSKPALAQSIFIRFRDLAHKRLKVQTNLWGTMHRENNLEPAHALGQPLSQFNSRSRLLRDIHTIGDRLIAEQPPENQTKLLKTFWQDFLNCQQRVPALPAASQRQSQPAAEPAPLKLTPSAGDESPTMAGKNESAPHIGTLLTTIAKELNLIRRLLENRSSGNRAIPEPYETTSPDATRLDFDEFMRKQQPGEER